MASIVYSDDFYKIGTLKESVSQSIKSIIMTAPGERFGDPLYGSNITQFIFDFDVFLPELIRDELVRAITLYEPRVSIQDIIIEKGSGDDSHKLFIKLYVLVISTLEQIEIVNELISPE
jgi:phage baseplate assembly protein W